MVHTYNLNNWEIWQEDHPQLQQIQGQAAYTKQSLNQATKMPKLEKLAIQCSGGAQATGLFITWEEKVQNSRVTILEDRQGPVQLNADQWSLCDPP